VSGRSDFGAGIDRLREICGVQLWTVLHGGDALEEVKP
jgi:hypothetical protein